MIVLTYHSVTQNKIEESVNAGGKHVQVKDFVRQVKYLSSKNCVAIDEINGNLKKGILVTFDDGFENIYTNAFQILKKYKIPFVVFISTGFVEGKLIWTDELLKLSLSIEDFYNKTKQWFSGNKLKLDLPITYNSLRLNMKNMSDQFRKQYFNGFQLEEQAPIPSRLNELFSPLGWDQLQEMLDSGLCEVGAHTQNHPILSQLSYDEQYEEVVSSKKKLEEKLDKEIGLFAYPNGRSRDFNEDTLSVLENSGFKYAFTTESGINRLRDFPYELRRYGITANLPMWKFKMLVNGYYELFR